MNGRSASTGKRNFPTEGYIPPFGDEDSYEQMLWTLTAEAEAMGKRRRTKRATRADLRVMRGPTSADEESIPYIQEAWEWAERLAGSMGLGLYHVRRGVVVDMLTRMRALGLIVRRQGIDEGEAARIVGFDPNWIQVEHNSVWSDVDKYFAAANEALADID